MLYQLFVKFWREISSRQNIEKPNIKSHFSAMDEFPTSEDEFELMYGDDLDVLREHDEPDKTPKKSRRSLEFAPKSSTQGTSSQDLFGGDFTPLEDSQTASNSNEIDQPSTSQKRLHEAIFGDIDDILFEEQEPKRQKRGEHEDELALIERIVELRKLAKERTGPEVARKDYTSSSDRDKRNLSYTVPNYPFIGVTRHDGERVYVRFHSEQYETEERGRIVKEINLTGTLGSTRDLWAEAQNLILKQSETVEISTPLDPTPDEDLWVDLYKPRKYFELLSDESTNRIMLRWMKLWDKVVFQRKPKPKPVSTDNKKNKFDLCTDLDEFGRPYHKVALLCGPPGLGKTTLAHMVAKHASYNVVEINASDDRSLDAFKTSLENATQMRSVLDAERRPNCLIFDEIDGAPAASIDYLVKFITGATASKTKKKKTMKEKNVLRRPIICICNDVYVPALRPLRQIAFVVNFPSTSNTRLAERLMEIARKQQVKTDMGAMLALAEKSQNDIRSCLSVLHFFKSESKPVTLSDVHKTSVGQKDTQKGIFSVWQDIFLIERPKNLENKSESLRDRMSRILNVVNSFGDYEKVAQGVFENFPNLKFKGGDMSETCWALEWFSYGDILNREIYASQNYTLSSYLQYGFVVWHFAFASRMWQKLQYPNAGYEARMKQNRQKAIVGELMRGIQPTIKSYVQPLCLTLDIIPMLPRIIAPNFRPISLHLYTEEEKKVLERVVNVMVDYNLNYVQERMPDGTYVYKIDPSIDEVVSFVAMKTLSYSNKQLIAQEIENTKMRRFEVAHQASEDEKKRQRRRKDDAAAVLPGTAPLPNHLQTLRVKSVSGPEMMPSVVKDFFGRIISKKSSSSGKLSQESKNDIWYQYKEGYNNAVRKKIKISSLK